MFIQTFASFIFRFLLWSFSLFVLLVASWYTANRLLDQAPYKGPIDFLISEEDIVPDEQNIAVGLLGLSAPSDSNFIKFGSKVASLYQDANFSQITRTREARDTLELTVDHEDVFCWTYYYGVNHPDCLPLDSAEKVLEENRLMLDRLRSLYTLEHHSNLYRYLYKDLSTINRLISAEIYLHLQRGEPDLAYEKWWKHISFSRKMLAGSGEWLDKTNSYLMLSFTLPLLEAIISAEPSLAIDKRTELLTLLNTEDTTFINLDSVVRADYAFLKSLLKSPPDKDSKDAYSTLIWFTYHFGQKQRILNRFVIFAEKYDKALRLPWDQAVIEIDRLKDTSQRTSAWDWILDPYGTIFLERFLKGNFLMNEFLIRLHAAKGKLRLASLYIKIISSELSDDEIPEFMRSLGPDYFDPLTNMPMQWDKSKRLIYLPHQDGGCGVYESFIIPKDRSPIMLSIARYDNQLC